MHKLELFESTPSTFFGDKAEYCCCLWTERPESGESDHQQCKVGLNEIFECIENHSANNDHVYVI
jgi:hypothetical protein